MTYEILFASLFLSVLIIIVLIIINRRENKHLQKLSNEKIELENLKKKEIKEYFKKEWSEEEKNLEDKIRIKRESAEKSFKDKIDFLETNLKEKEKRYNEVNQDLDLYREGKIKEIDSAAAEYEQHKQLIIDNSLKEYRILWTGKFNEDLAKINETRTAKLEELSLIEKELEIERGKRAAINEEIRRAKEVEMKQDFYRIRFSEEDKNDVEILRSVAPRLRHPEAINKVIWSAYYQKPLTELRKRLLPNGDKSGIYKITRLKTGEIYIGSTTSFDTRFVNHYKTALGVGTLASSQLHRTMKEDGPEHFTVEILEEDIPKEKLKERESYYIDFYDSKNYGLNTIRGEQK